MEAHQTVLRAGTIEVSANPKVLKMELLIPRELRYRRLYLGWFFQSEPISGTINVSARFVSNSAAAERAKFRFQWAFPVSDLTTLVVSEIANGGACLVPPFSIEAIADGAEFPWPSVSPSHRDEMTVLFPDIFVDRSMIVRMMPIPVVCTADLLEVSVSASWAAGVKPFPGIQVFAGVRSSASFPG